MGSFTEGITVVCREGDNLTPELVLYRGRSWKVYGEPIRWWERRKWWQEDSRVPAGTDIRMDYARWQVQVRESGQLWESHEPLTLDLMHNLRADSWRLVMLQDANKLRYAELDESVDDSAEVLYADFSA